MEIKDKNAAQDFKDFVDLMAVFKEAQQRLASIEAEVDEAYMEIIDTHRGSYATLQNAITVSTTAIEAMVAKHPEWFMEKRTVKCPYGSVKVTRTTKLDAKNEEASILLIEKAATETGKDQADVSAFRQKFVRTKEELNLEALGELSDEELARFRVKRVRSESVTITESKVDFGTAVKAVEKAEKEKEGAK